MCKPGRLTIRDATDDDVSAIRAFGEAVIPAHYTPLIGEQAARAQADSWWTDDRISQSVAAGCVAVAEGDDRIVGVAERGEWEGNHVIWKLYVRPGLRGRGIGPRLLQRLVAQLPPDAASIRVEHFAANERAGAFYEREGFRELETRPHPTNPGMSVIWRERKLNAAP